MIPKATSFLLLLIMTVHSGNGQNLASHKWTDRVILIFSDDADSNLLESQRSEIFSNPTGLQDRKLVVYTLLRNRYSIGPDGEWSNSDLFDTFKPSKGKFEVILIGLDGQVKFRDQKLVKIQKIFDLIDAMPMRRSELRNKN